MAAFIVITTCMIEHKVKLKVVEVLFLVQCWCDKDCHNQETSSRQMLTEVILGYKCQVTKENASQWPLPRAAGAIGWGQGGKGGGY